MPPNNLEAVTVTKIVGARLGGRYTRDQSGDIGRRTELAINFFRFLREDSRGLERRPTLAELLDCKGEHDGKRLIVRRNDAVRIREERRRADKLK